MNFLEKTLLSEVYLAEFEVPLKVPVLTLALFQTMALRLVSKRFTPLSKKQANHGLNHTFWLRKVVDEHSNVLPYYRSVVAQLDSLGNMKGDLSQLSGALKRKDEETTINLWKSITKAPYSPATAPTFQELAEKYHCYGPPQLELVISHLAKLDAAYLKKLWIAAEKAPICAYLFPKIIDRQIKNGRNEPALETIWAISELCELKREVQALNFAINIYLMRTGVDFESLTRLLDGIAPDRAPRLGEKTAEKLAQLPRTQLLPCFNYLQERKVPMNKKGFSSFLRAVFASSDEAAKKVIEDADRTEYPPGFYHYLTRYFCQTKDSEALDWLFENPLMKIAHDMPQKIPFVLHLLIMRTIAVDGVRSITHVLDKMGEVPESTWMVIFQNFRRLGRLDKCTETLHRALSRGHKLSLPFVGEYLETVATFYNMEVYFKSLKKILPEMVPVLDQLGITRLATTQLAMDTHETPLLTIGKEVRGFRVHRIHESWLNITYKVVLNNVDDVGSIQDLFAAYRDYVLASQTPTTLAVVDEFVLKLTSMKTPEAIDAAEAILLGALDSFKLKPVKKANHNCKSLGALLYSMTRHEPDLQRIVLLVNEVLASPAVSVRGSALKPLLVALENHKEQDSIKEWAEKLGARFQ